MQEYPVTCPKLITDLKYELLKFNTPLKNDFVPNIPGKIYRQHHLEPKKYKNLDEDDEPKYGANSSYKDFVNAEIKSKHLSSTKIDDKTWTLNIGSGKSLRSFKGHKEGNISDNCEYYVFIPSGDGKSFEAYPISTWYSFTRIPKYKTLNDEEAEKEFMRRDKVLNYFSIMVQKRLGAPEDDEGKKQRGGGQENGERCDNNDNDDESMEAGTSSTNYNQSSAGTRPNKTTNNSLKLRDIDDEIGFMDDRDADDDEDNEDLENRKPKPKPGINKNKRDKKTGVRKNKVDEVDGDNVVGEDSDDGDVEGQELDYDSAGESSTSSDTDARQSKKKSIGKSQEQSNDSELLVNQASAISIGDLIDSGEEELGVADEPGLRDLHDDEDDVEDQGGEDGELEEEEDDDLGNKTEATLKKIQKMSGAGEESSEESFDDEDENSAKGSKRYRNKDNANQNGDEATAGAKKLKRSKQYLNDKLAFPTLHSDNVVATTKKESGDTSSSSSESSATSSDDSDMDDINIKSSIFLQKKSDIAVAKAKEKQYASLIQESVNKTKELQSHQQNVRQKSENVAQPHFDPNMPSTSTKSAVAITGVTTSLELTVTNVRRYLQRRPMTAKELLHKFKNVRVSAVSGSFESRTQLAERMTTILKELNPERKTFKGKMYFSLNVPNPPS